MEMNVAPVHLFVCVHLVVAPYNILGYRGSEEKCKDLRDTNWIL